MTGRARKSPPPTRRQLTGSRKKSARLKSGDGHLIQRSRHARTREVIVEAARRIYRREGYSAVTLRAIAGDIGCSVGLIYTYFLDKDEIFSVLQNDGLKLFAESVAEVTGTDPVDALRLFFLRYYEFSKKHPDYFNLLWVDRVAPRYSPGQADLKAAIAQGHSLVQRCLDEGIFPPGYSVVIIAHVLWSAVHGPAVLRQLQNREHSTEDDHLAQSALDLALMALRGGGLASGSGKRRPTARLARG